MSNQIKFLNLNITNFGRHESLSVDFADTLTVLKGPNGAGKSTVLQAIYFALFGVSAVDGTAKDIPRHGCKDCEVLLSLTINGERFTVGRSLKTATVYTDAASMLQASGHTSVNEWIEDKLGVVQKTFLALTYSPQTETAAIMSIGAAALNRMVEQIAEVDFITSVEKKSSQFAYGADNQLSALGQPRDVGEMRVNLEKAKVDHVGATVRCKTSEEEMVKAKQEHKDFQTEVKKVQEAHLRKKTLDEDLNKANLSIQRQEVAMEHALAEITKISATPEALEVINTKKNEFQQEANARSVQHSEYMSKKRKMRELEKWLSENPDYQALWDDLNPKLREAEEIEARRKEESDAARAALRQAEATAAEAAKALESAVCPTCNRAFDDADLAAAEQRAYAIEADVRAAKDEVTKVRAAYDAAHAVTDGLRKRCPGPGLVEIQRDKKTQYEEMKAQDISLPFDESQIEADQEKLGELLAQHKDIKRQLTNKENYETEYNSALERANTAKAKREAIEKELAEIGDTDMVVVTAKSQELHAKAMETEQTYAKAKQELSSYEMTIKGYEQEIAKAEDLMTRRAVLERRSANFDGLTKYLRSNRATFMSELWDQLMGLTSQFVFDVTGGRIERIERAETGEFLYVEGGRKLAYARLAGGFKAVAGVGLRLALASLLPAGVSVLVLDEPSSELADDMAAALAGALRAQDRQIVLVTHRVGEEYTADAVTELTL